MHKLSKQYSRLFKNKHRSNDSKLIREGKDIKVTKQMWNTLSDDQKETALLSRMPPEAIEKFLDRDQWIDDLWLYEESADVDDDPFVPTYGKGDVVHDCPKHVKEQKTGAKGKVFGHTLNEAGKVNYVDVDFGKYGRYNNIPVTDLVILESQSHAHEVRSEA